jgi:hypothetical protein
MAQRLLASMSTAEITDGNQVAFTLKPAMFTAGNGVVVSAEGLASSETLSFWKWVGSSWVPVTDASDAQVVYTDTAPSDVFNAGGEFGITKTATAGAVSLYADDPR